MSLPSNATTIFECYIAKYSKMLMVDSCSIEAHNGLGIMLNNLLDYYGIYLTEEIIKKYNLEMFGFKLQKTHK